MTFEYSVELRTGLERMLTLVGLPITKCGPERPHYKLNALLVLAGLGGVRLTYAVNYAPRLVPTSKLRDILSVVKQRKWFAQSPLHKDRPLPVETLFQIIAHQVLKTDDKLHRRRSMRLGRRGNLGKIGVVPSLKLAVGDLIDLRRNQGHCSDNERDEQDDFDIMLLILAGRAQARLRLNMRGQPFWVPAISLVLDYKSIISVGDRIPKGSGSVNGGNIK